MLIGSTSATGGMFPNVPNVPNCRHRIVGQELHYVSCFLLRCDAARKVI